MLWCSFLCFQFDLMLSEDGSGRGAALVAAVAVRVAREQASRWRGWRVECRRNHCSGDYDRLKLFNVERKVKTNAFRSAVPWIARVGLSEVKRCGSNRCKAKRNCKALLYSEETQRPTPATIYCLNEYRYVILTSFFGRKADFSTRNVAILGNMRSSPIICESKSNYLFKWLPAVLHFKRPPFPDRISGKTCLIPRTFFPLSFIFGIL